MPIVNANNEAADNDIEIEVVDPTPEEDKGREPLPQLSQEEEDSRSREMDDYSKRVQNRIGEMTHRIHDERRAKEQALREKEESETLAQQLYDENQRLQQTLAWGRQEYINTFNDKLNAAQELAEATYRQGAESGDTEKMVAAQRAFSEIATQRARLQSMMGDQPIQQPTHQQDDRRFVPQQPQQVLTQEQEPEYSPPQQPEAAVEVDPVADDWHMRNPWFGQDQEMTTLTMQVHGRLASEGVEVGSDQYWRLLDQNIHSAFPEKFGKPRRTSPVAPAGRTTQSSKKVTLTPSEVARAKKFGIPLERYAREKAKLLETN